MADLCGIDMEGFEGPWYTHPVLHNTLFATALTGITFTLAHLNVIPKTAEIVLFGLANGGDHWLWV